MGFDTDAESAGCLAIGRYNIGGGNPTTWDSNDPAFEIGNGVNASNRSNAFQVLQNGNTTINGQLTLSDRSSSITFPNSDGSSGQVLQTNGSGTLSWSSISSGGSSGLEQITENGNNGFRLTGSDPNNFGDIGANSTDLSTQTQASTTRGATGLYSLASGENTTASSYRSTAMGNNTIASNENSTAMGINTNASGNSSTAMGNSTTASGTNSTAMGSNNTASGTSSTAMGRGTVASGSYSTSLGELSTASGSRSLAAGQHASATAANSIAIGHAATASGYGSIALGGEGNESAGLYSTAMGRYTKAHSIGELTIGSFNTNYNPVGGASTWDNLDRLFVIGNGTSQNNRSNAFLVLKNGNTTINGQLTLSDGSSSITFPNSDGSNNQVLQTNGSGTLSWSSISSGVSSLNDLSDALSEDNSVYVGSVPSSTNLAQYNVGLGKNVLSNITTGDRNVGMGYKALNANTSGRDNTALGREALMQNTDGEFNVGIGAGALLSSTSADQNVAIGYGAMYNNSTGGSNVALGKAALTSNMTGDENTATGINALYANTTGDENTATGSNALYANTTGSRNTAIGFEAMKNSTTAGENTAVGYMSMFNNSGSYNVSLGQNTLTLSSGSRNVAIGYSSLWQNSSGSDNLSIGYQSGHENTSGSNNVALGKHSLYSLASGSYNTGVGSHTNTSSLNSVNQTVIGSFATGVADNSVTLGNSNVTAVYMAQNANATVYAGGLYVSGNIHTGDIFTSNIQANNIQANNIFAIDVSANSFTTSSDKRFKKDIKPIANSLDNVLKLRGVSYNFKVEEYSNKKFPADTQIGFIAQELLEIYPQLISKDKEGYYSVDYSKISPILVEAIKEQQKKIDKLETELGLIKNYLNIKEE
jgi:hypothetical protein